MPQKQMTERRVHMNALSSVRGILAVNALVAWYSAMTDSSTLLFKVAQTLNGNYLLWGMALFAVAILVDAVLNDWTPDDLKFGNVTANLNWKRAFVGRHWLMLGLASCYGAQPVVALLSHEKVEALSYFIWYPISILYIAFLDAKQRSRETECLKTAS